MFVPLYHKTDRMKHLLIIFSFLLAFTSCSKDDDIKTSPNRITPAPRTVIVYMSGENDISSYLSADLQELIAGRRQLVGDANLVVFVDKASTAEKPFIAKITTDTQHPLDTLYKYSDDFYASDPDAMRDVIERAVTFCPATRDYGLILWGHASGWVVEKDSIASKRAYGRDTGNNYAGKSGKWMNIPSMRRALQMAGIHWKFIFCDCCNMQCVEVAYELRPQTDYFIASPAEITGVGAPYDTMVKDFFITDDKTMGIQMCVDYNAQFDYVGGHLPISVVQSDKLEALAKATSLILPDVDSYLKTAENPTKGLIYYYAYNYNYEREKTLYDMYGLIRAALAGQPEKLEAWETAFNETVIYSETSTRWHAQTINFSDFSVTPDNYGGISMFFPMAKYANASHDYNQDIRNFLWYYAVGWSALGW